jgi:hypothetical protein
MEEDGPPVRRVGKGGYISRLRQLGLLKRVHGTYRRYLSKIGRAAVAACSHLTENVLIPSLA